MHHGTCVAHVPWCMSGSLTRGGGENVPGIPGACATRTFTYLARGPFSKAVDGHPVIAFHTMFNNDWCPSSFPCLKILQYRYRIQLKKSLGPFSSMSIHFLEAKKGNMHPCGVLYRSCRYLVQWQTHFNLHYCSNRLHQCKIIWMITRLHFYETRIPKCAIKQANNTGLAFYYFLRKQNQCGVCTYLKSTYYVFPKWSSQYDK